MTIGFVGGALRVWRRDMESWRKYYKASLVGALGEPILSLVAIGYGLFMITVDGVSSDVKLCKNYACQISPVTRSQALSECQARQKNRRCVVFAEGRDIKYAYQVVP